MTGLIVRADKTGLGMQTRRLTRLLKPDRLLIIDSYGFYLNGNQQNYNWYYGYEGAVINGFPSNEEIQSFLNGLDVVISCETFYSNHFTTLAKQAKVKSILIANYEFFDWLQPTYTWPLPDKVVTPSYWHLDEMQRDYNAVYLPTPIFKDEFKDVRKANTRRKGKTQFLFINGRTAVHDRNGLELLYGALEYAKGDFTVTVKAQHDVKKHPDSRLIYDFSNPDDQQELYKGFDALILPRRYGGQALSMSEALLSGLPVIMTDINPNNLVLPGYWLVPAYKTGEFMTRTMIDIYSVEPPYLAHKLDNFDVSKREKQRAVEIGKQFEAGNLRSKYEELLK